MSNNGAKKTLVVKVELHDGKLDVEIGNVNLALVSHAIRLLGLQIDNIIIAKESHNQEQKIQTPDMKITIPNSVRDKLRG